MTANNDLIRYSLITEKLPREFLLLQGTGCRWKRCVFCDYYHDVSVDPFEINRQVLSHVTGETGVLDVINSGSCTEMDEKTVRLLQAVVSERSIETLWFEAHWMYRERLAAFASLFPGARVKFRIGAETFDPVLRASWEKGIPDWVGPEEMSRCFQGCCLLIGVEGQTEAIIASDIEKARSHFEYVSINAFVENSSPLKRDQKLVDWYIRTLYPSLENDPQIEVLLENTDLGVG